MSYDSYRELDCRSIMKIAELFKTINKRDDKVGKDYELFGKLR